MVDSSDFTFCKVGLQAEDDNLESPKALPDVKRIILEDNPGVSIRNNPIPDDTSRGSATLKSQPDISPFNNSSKTITPKSDGEAKDSEQKQKPVVRAKVPFEKGYSQMDWLKLTRTHPDLAGLKGWSNQGLILMDEVKQHKTGGSIWTVLKGRVYNISPYMKFHPRG